MLLLIRLIRFLCDRCSNFIGPKSTGVECYNYKIEENVNIKVYRPRGASKRRPVIIYYHGGGWVIGSIKSYDPIMRYISSHADCIIVAVDYRKSPEYKFPAAINDVHNSYKWVLENISEIQNNLENLVICGDSAGGGLALNLLSILHEQNHPSPFKLILIYPLLVTKIPVSKKVDKNGLIYKISAKALEYFLNQYLKTRDERKHPYLELLDNFNANVSYPQTFIITGEYDALNEGIRQFTLKLEDCGTKILTKEYKNQTHGFINFAGISKGGMLALSDIAKYIRE